MSDLKRLPIIFLFVFSFFVRFLLISKGPYHADTLLLAETSSAILQDHRLYYLQASGLPLTALLGAGFILLNRLIGMPDAVEAINLMSVVLSSLSICFFFLFAQQLFNKTVALVSCVTLALHPTFWVLSTFGNSHIPTIFFFVLGLNALIRNNEKLSGNALLAGLFFGLMGAARFQALILCLPAGIILLTRQFLIEKKGSPDRRLLAYSKDLGLFLITVWCTALIFYIPKISASPGMPLARRLLDFFHSHIVLSYTQIFSETGRLGLEALLGPFTLGGVLFALAGLWKCWQQDKMTTLFLLTWVILPSLFYCGFIYIVPRFFVLPALAICLLLGLGVEWSLQKNVFTRVFALCLLIFSLLCTTSQVWPILTFRHQHDLIVAYYRWLQTQTEPNAQVMDRDNSLFMTKYAQRQPISLPRDYVFYPRDELAAFKEQLERTLAQGIPVYTTAVGVFGFNPEHRYPEFMDQHFAFEFVGTHLIEDWHRGCLRQDIHYLPLFRVYAK